MLAVFVSIPVVELAYAVVSTVIYNVTADTNGRAISGQIDNVKFDGEEVTSTSNLTGKFFDKITIKIRCSDNDGGTCEDLPGSGFLGIWSSTVAPTDTNYKKLITNITANTISTVGAEYTFNFGGYSLSADEVVGLYYGYDCTPSSSNCWLSLRFNTESYNSTSTRESYYDNSPAGWNDVTAQDIRMTLFNSGGGVGTGICPGTDVVCFDVDGDGIIDVIFNRDPVTGVVEGNLADFPPLVGPISQTFPAFLQAFTGVPFDTASVLFGILFPIMFVVLGAMAFGSFKINPTQVPAFVYGLIWVAGMGFSITLGWLESWWIVVAILGFAASFATKIKGVIG